MSSLLSGEERLLRNVHPNDFDNGRINSSCFDPSAGHQFKLSLDREILCSAKSAHLRHIEAGLASVGVYGLLCSDFNLQSISCYSDPLPTNPAHALADFSSFGSNARRRKARILANIASAGGALYSPD